MLEGDQALAGKILKLVNSSFYGQSGEIATITRAVVVLGFAAVRNLALGLAAGGALKNAGGADYQRRFWSHALATAAAAETLARRCGQPVGSGGGLRGRSAPRHRPPGAGPGRPRRLRRGLRRRP